MDIYIVSASACVKDLSMVPVAGQGTDIKAVLCFSMDQQYYYSLGSSTGQ